MTSHKNSTYLAIIGVLFLCVSGCATSNYGQEYDESRQLRSSIAEVPQVKQTKSYSCGAAALASLLNFWDKDTSEQKILEHHPPRDGLLGYSLGELKIIAEQYKMHAFAIAGNESVLRQQIDKGRPVIVALKIPLTRPTPIGPVGLILQELLGDELISYNHFVVVVGYSDDIYRVIDPARDYIDVKRNEFKAHWSKLMNASLVAATLSAENQ